MSEPCQKYHNVCENCDELFWCKDGMQTLCGDCAWVENKELNALFDLQHSRSQKAESMWRKATNNPNTIPDLGVLLEWLMAEVRDWKRYEQANVDTQYKRFVIAHDEAIKQRRHHKWALKKARNLWDVISMARKWKHG